MTHISREELLPVIESIIREHVRIYININPDHMAEWRKHHPHDKEITVHLEWRTDLNKRRGEEFANDKDILELPGGEDG